jgi:hypothetical protein
MNWKIDFLKCLPSVGGVSNYVVECGWRVSASLNGHTSGEYGVCAFPPPESVEREFVDYTELTESQVLGWCWDGGVNKAEIEARVLAKIDELANPTILIPPLPWVA